MEAKTILSDYLIKRSYLETIIPYNYFKRLFPAGIDDELVKSFYSELKNQRQDISIDPIESNIQNTFDVPIEHVINREDNSTLVSKSSLADLNKSLEKLLGNAHLDNENYDAQIASVLKDIRLLIDQLNDSRYPHNLDSIDDLVSDSLDSSTKLELALHLRS
ncbi:uncharacterized protein RJT21DRAFT_4594 [Scheffersomyces amazonensis]|uniref:uncharacterized protein n=1 Tax=Scheffersomyces amazonensis TaxID=1078765 RepID=UPI00315C8A84